jgi:hypothetical protein
MYYSYVEIEYVATSFSSARMDLAVKLLTNQFDQVVCVAIVIYYFKIYSLIRLRGCIAQSVANQKVRLE